MILQVLICTYGADGIGRVASCCHPEVPGVQYLISWQASDGVPTPESLLRKDFLICRTDTIGLSKNRNDALSNATAPLLLISDDDVNYTQDWLSSVIKAFADHPDMDFIAFKYISKSHQKHYPEVEYNIKKLQKGHFISSIEMAFRREAISGKVRFNENFGVGARFPSGEEDIFFKDCLDLGVNALYLPIVIARHDGSTTSERNLMLPSRPQTKGAVFLRLHPHSWPLRMLAHALREVPLWRRGLVPSPFSYCINWLKGAWKAKNIRWST